MNGQTRVVTWNEVKKSYGLRNDPQLIDTERCRSLSGVPLTDCYGKCFTLWENGNKINNFLAKFEFAQILGANPIRGCYQKLTEINDVTIPDNYCEQVSHGPGSSDQGAVLSFCNGNRCNNIINFPPLCFGPIGLSNYFAFL